MKLSIIVPLFNEEKNILIVLNQLAKTEYPSHLERV